MKTFEKLVEVAYARCNTEEGNIRIKEEKQLIESRGCEKYLSFCADLIAALRSTSDFECVQILKSALDSFILYMNVDGSNEEKFLSDPKKKEVFFNDACRLTLSIHKMDINRLDAQALDSIITKTLETYGLSYNETLRDTYNEFRYGSSEAKEDLIVISKEPISKTDLETVKKFGQQSLTENDEKTILKYLILKVQIFSGI